MENSKKLLYSIGITIFITISGILGAKYLSLFFNGDKFPGITFGVLIAFGLSYIFSPALKKQFPGPEHKESSNEALGNFWKTYTHPTNLPMLIGSLWFLVFGVLFPSETKGSSTNNFILQPIMFLFGLSGFQLLRLKEGMGRFGRKYYGFWVYFLGILAILLGWGGLIIDILGL